MYWKTNIQVVAADTHTHTHTQTHTSRKEYKLFCVQSEIIYLQLQSSNKNNKTQKKAIIGKMTAINI